MDDGLTAFEDLGIEVSRSFGDDATWYCWLRAIPLAGIRDLSTSDDENAERGHRSLRGAHVSSMGPVEQSVRLDVHTGGGGADSRRGSTPRPPASYGHTQVERARTGRYAQAGASGTRGRSREAG